MPHFHNATPDAVRTVIGSKSIEVPPGGNLELPRSLAWVVRARGLRLADGKHADPSAPAAVVRNLAPARQVLPRGVELGPVRDRARQENEDPEIGDGDKLEGDDAPVSAIDGDGDADPIERTAKQLEASGIDLAELPGGKPTRKGHLRGIR